MENDTYKRTDYERGYRDGYRDGIADINKLCPKQFPETSWKGPKCNKCNISFEGFMGYVCSQSNCPMMPVTYSTVNSNV